MINSSQAAIREVNADELELVSGGNAVLGFIAGYVAGKLLDAAFGSAKHPIVEQIENNTGKLKPLPQPQQC